MVVRVQVVGGLRQAGSSAEEMAGSRLIQRVGTRGDGWLGWSVSVESAGVVGRAARNTGNTNSREDRSSYTGADEVFIS